jgi:hypothetical protein
MAGAYPIESRLQTGKISTASTYQALECRHKTPDSGPESRYLRAKNIGDFTAHRDRRQQTAS